MNIIQRNGTGKRHKGLNLKIVQEKFSCDIHSYQQFHDDVFLQASVEDCYSTDHQLLVLYQPTDGSINPPPPSTQQG
jgi:hypothetical protein